uniref:Microsomal glutathione S-transferase 1 n=1 Tax=Timema californicum TaxID=61474 RepID=A0A7R9PD42_TIMCA|nr:unnamed protein product [Timema californicum]
MGLLYLLRRVVFANPEDAVGKGAKVRFDNTDIERVRRAHLNDLENIPIFFVASFFYQFTNPAPFIAINLIRVFALTRILHTIVYAVFPMPQPSRALAWGVGYGITGYMAVKTILYFI